MIMREGITRESIMREGQQQILLAVVLEHWQANTTAGASGLDFAVPRCRGGPGSVV
jgi:hypothetical protein